MEKRYYDLNENGKQKASYSRKQKDKDLLYLPAAPTSTAIWNFELEQWEEPISTLRNELIQKADDYFISRFHKFNNTSLKADDRIQIYQDFITEIETATTEQEMNLSYTNMIDLLEGN